ncbi:type II toxin-antitoxin system VapC family toxin [Nocardia stercoris]|uniref:type II toxin-antitoxin system VapC family toxin n=1 Tax=Nocardia stercoris TaxID=2483361 RepID=UPI001F1C7A61|nr:DNA-binding protein [Nocardia stercoris]
MAFVQECRKLGMRVAVSALTIIEATHAGTDRKRLAWLLSGMHIEPVDDSAAHLASKLLQANGLHGHTHAIDAVVAEAAIRQSAPVVLMTSDLDDMTTLCGDEVHLIRT